MSLLQLSLDINSIIRKYEEEQERICNLRILSANIDINDQNQLKSIADNIIICNGNNLEMLRDIETLANRLLDIIRNNQRYSEALECEINSNIEFINNTLRLIELKCNNCIQQYKRDLNEFIHCYINNHNYKELISEIIESYNKNKGYLDKFSMIIETINSIDNGNN